MNFFTKVWKIIRQVGKPVVKATENAEIEKVADKVESKGGIAAVAAAVLEQEVANKE